MINIDTDEKKKIVSATPLHPEICLGSWAVVKILIQVFTMKQSYFCNFDIKNKFLGLKNPHRAVFRHQIAPEMEIQHYFHNLGTKCPLEAQNSNRDNLKIT